MPMRPPAIIYCLLSLMLTLFASASWAFGFDDVAERARKLADAPYRQPDISAPDELRTLSYSDYQNIHFKSEQALWHQQNLPFVVEFFHPGNAFVRPVRINVFGSNSVEAIPFKPEDFDYGSSSQLDPKRYAKLDFSGFLVRFALNGNGSKDEVLNFHGASYLRALGQGQRHGLTARGLSVDTGMSSGEEFPYFTEFWIGWPKEGDTSLVIYGLLDSRRVAGAYRFELHPGPQTRVDTQARLFLRDNVGKLGIAPLSSMYSFGENQPAGGRDYRPEAHDSDGLSVLTGSGEWIWRPLVNPRRLLVTSMAVDNPRGFGLMQRDRRFASYEDLSARFDLRPSVWVTPRGNWGKGRVELVQIPTPDETNDNIVAYWVRDAPPLPGQAFDVAYTLSWQLQDQTRPPTAHVTQTLTGRGSTQRDDNALQMVVDFEGPSLRELPPHAQLFAALSVSDNGELIDRQVLRNEVTGGWRLMFRFRRMDDQKPMDMRALLKYQDEVISETWSYILPPS